MLAAAGNIVVEPERRQDDDSAGADVRVPRGVCDRADGGGGHFDAAGVLLPFVRRTIFLSPSTQMRLGEKVWR